MANFDDTKIKFTSLGSVKSGEGMEPVKVLKKRITTADMDAAATSDTVDFDAQLPAGCILMHIGYQVDVLADDGASIASATLDLGDGSDADRFLNAVDILTGSGSTGFGRANPANPDGDAATDTYPLPLAAATTLRATVTADVNVDTLTALDVTLYAYYFYPESPRG